MSNIYYHPEEHAAEIVDSVDIDGDSGFEMWVVWKKGDKILWGSDSGCSCPAPFEDYSSVEEMRPLTKESYLVMERELTESPRYERNRIEVDGFLCRVRKLL